jgi:hypothetical protein
MNNNYPYFNVLFYLLLLISSPLQAGSFSSAIVNKTKDITYAGSDKKNYPIQLLKHALSYDNSTDYRFIDFGKRLPKMREFNLLGKANGIDVVVGGATMVRERLALPIRFPIMQGLFGWRIALVHQDNQNIFKSIKSLKNFKKFSALQFHTWSDSETLLSNDITLIKGTDVEGLYMMLDKKRADYFPRSVLEIDSDLAKHQHLAIVKEKNILIWYPKAVYFYVGKNQTALATSIRRGLELSLSDGSFKALFMKYYGDIISKLQAENRHVFKLNNPLLSPLTPLSRAELWLDLSSTLLHQDNEQISYLVD